MTDPVVLVAIDDEREREAVIAALSTTGLTVVTAPDAPPDVAIAGGAKVVDRLRQTLRADIPIVALAAENTEIEQVLARGALDFVRSSADSVEVRARVFAALRVRRSEVERDEARRTDALTGLANRRHATEHLDMTAGASRRHGALMSVLTVDVDHLRRINDEHGQAAGDEVLREVASRTTAVLRIEDMAGRWGGEEFIVILPSTDIDGAWRLAERVREAISAQPIVTSSTAAGIVVTVSIGCAEGHGDNLDDLLRRADLALEEAKAEGRNRTVRDTTFAA